ncbi:MAG: hypothetical protein IJZ14_00105 [Oscillospiraceae bacterium]|nr:hypothetical protein [Oscillospiraceae bacterium]MBQ8881463.1 hypothetical protein [Oscillospiraceae bacterium]
MVRIIVNILFALLAVCTFVLGLFILTFECAADGFAIVVAFVYGPVIVALVFGSEYFWWRSVSLLVSYNDEKPLVVGTSIANAILSSATLIYMAYGIFLGFRLKFSYVLFAFAAQLFCRFLIWIQPK